MPVLTFSPAGVPLPLRLSPSEARREVARSRARYVHGPSVAPHPRHGSVILYDPWARKAKYRRSRVPVLNADGTLIGWVRPYNARRYARAGYWRPVGDNVPPDQAYGVMFEELLDADALFRVACWDVWLGMEHAVQVGVLRRRLEKLAERDPDDPSVQQWALHELTTWMHRFHLGPEAIETMDDLLHLRRETQQLRNLDLTRDADFARVRHWFVG